MLNLNLFKRRILSFLFSALMLFSLMPFVYLSEAKSLLGDNEFTGKLEAILLADTEDTDQVIFRPFKDMSKVKFASPPEESGATTAARLYNPLQDKSSLLAVLIEPEDENPVIYADVNQDSTISKDERFEFKRGEDDNPYMLEVILQLPMQNPLFKTCPVFLQYYKNVRWDGLKEGEQIIEQSKRVFAKGIVDIKGRKTNVLYTYKISSNKISPSTGILGVDSDGDGVVDLERLSPESASAKEETIIFRAGNTFVSTKKVDIEQNTIIMREHSASDYKRTDLYVGQPMPDFQFTDWDGKKRKLSDFRGKYVLVDFWGMWCPPCVRELSYLREAYKRFQAREFEILGMNTDDDFESLKPQMNKNGMNWTQARQDSILNVIKSYRIHLFPTTILLDPEGKVVSLNQTKKGQPSLRGQSLLKTLDEILPL